MLLYQHYRRLLFQLPPEQAHHVALMALHYRWYKQRAPRYQETLRQTVMGLSFSHPIGLAAGFDKDGVALSGLQDIGFSHIECGTVTPRPQAGNPSPRLFRLPAAAAIINRMGFNNAGVMALAQRLEQRPRDIIIGVNIGKNRDTPVEEATSDYGFCYRVIYPYADYVTVNISSPNTAQLRDLQSSDSLERLVAAMQNAKDQLSTRHRRVVPIAVKVAPDLTSAQIEAMARVFNAYKIDAVLATNTTIDKRAVSILPYGQEEGGLSGVPLQNMSTDVIGQFRLCLDDSIPIIGLGGIADSQSAQAKLDAGATLLQLYTSMVYQGPEVLAKIIGGISIPP